ncbi:uncharacterized protein N7477_009722 [Penicillium maclennaniae]|uniref:uncharacterized protein n=1 Tax=Penicillium maclennaniae TaxID=1343394 RepID=UPI002540373F|nr:uncharacterized protein N7477_009722 [Penicillium maclennaniae]KAJ5662106.1 hypothetical protein N7477_009722 [Penicillium maclennaniae]
MVILSEVQASNAQIATALPPGLVAVFVGGTNGIGEAALLEFARQALQPRVYFVGRSQEAGDRIATECRDLNPNGEFTFMEADLSLMRNVEDVCQEIKSKENAINLLFLSCGVAMTGVDTSEGLHITLAVGYYARVRFTINLLPLLRQATGLRRVVTVLAGGHDGPIDPNDFQARRMSIFSLRGQVVSMTDLMLEELAKQAPEVSFVHDYPGTVKTGIGRDANTLLVRIVSWIMPVVGLFLYIPIQESGERHLFFATSDKYPPRTGDQVGVPGGVGVADGTDGESGSGVYSIHWDGESVARVVGLLRGLREQGMAQQVWNHTQGEFKRIFGA